MTTTEQHIELLMQQNAALMQLLQGGLEAEARTALPKRKLTFDEKVQIKMRELEPRVFKLLDKQNTQTK